MGRTVIFDPYFLPRDWTCQECGVRYWRNTEVLAWIERECTRKITCSVACGEVFRERYENDVVVVRRYNIKRILYLRKVQTQLWREEGLW